MPIASILFAATAIQAAPATAPTAPPAEHRVVVHRAEAPAPVVHGANVCLPMQLSDGLPVVPATVQGRPVMLGFDTGAPGVPHLDSAAIEQLKLNKVGEARASDPSGRNVQTIGLYELHDLKLGGFSIDQWLVTEHPRQPTRLFDPDGIIGLDAFAGYVVTFDYPGRRVLIGKGRLADPDNRSTFHYDGPIPHVPLSIDGQTIDSHIDTGNARYSLIVPEGFAARLPGYAERYPIGTAHTVNNKYDLVALPIRESKVGGFPLYAGTAAYPAPATMGNIGSQILKDMIVKVDPANSLVSLERAKPGLEDGCPNS